jgi:excisionase family DNA binding protein
MRAETDRALIGPKRFFTVYEAAEMLRVSTSTIYRAAQSGEIPGFKVRRQWRFPAAAIERLAGEPIESLIG